MFVTMRRLRIGNNNARPTYLLSCLNLLRTKAINGKVSWVFLIRPNIIHCGNTIDVIMKRG